LVEKISRLPSERVAEVSDFVEFLLARESDRGLTRDAARLAEPSFQDVWDNPEDSIYDDV